MNIIRIVFEQGLVLRRISDTWQVANTESDHPPPIVEPSEISARYGLRPVLITERLDSGKERTFLLATQKPDLFGLHITDIQQRTLRTEGLILKAQSVLYMLGALEYHCSKLCELYANTCGHFSGLPNPERTERAIFSGKSESYYEFEALVTALRRTYDSLRFSLWHFFGPGKGDLPVSFYRVLPLCTALPPTLSEKLRESWDTLGVKITAYRDCIQHYAPVAFSLGAVHMSRGPAGAWTMRALIPDNPQARTASKFTFRHGIDALTFGLDAANSLLQLCTLVISAAERQSKKAD
jgi:hypothetical protein